MLSIEHNCRRGPSRFHRRLRRATLAVSKQKPAAPLPTQPESGAEKRNNSGKN